MKKEFQRLEEGPEVDIHLDSQRSILKKIQNWKTPGFDGIKGLWF